MLKKLKAKVKIFFYGENLERYEPYNNIELLKSTFDLIVGFKYTDVENKIIRLPLWLMYYNYYNMNDTNNNIITYLENKYKINSKINKSNFCSLIARHDRGGQRTLLLREMDKYGKVMCPSGFNHNCSSIRQGNESKIDFVKQCKYNICPENSKYEGYFTEKIFQAFECGCIPIYWAIDEPEKEILNKNKYCFVTNINDKNEVSEKIKDVIENPEKYLEGNIFNKDAYDTLDKYYNTFISEIKKRL
jgi:alpha(1,3/1,4) fucosyltransferase